MNNPPASPARPKRRFYLAIGAATLVVIVVVAGAIAAFKDSESAGTAQVQRNLAVKSAGVAMMAPSAAPEMMVEASYGEAGGYAADEVSIMPPIIEPSGGQTAAEVDQKIIKNGSLSLTVKGVGEAASQITALAAGKGGYVQTSSVEERIDGTHYGNISIRVPAREFENALSDIKKLALVVKSESVSGQDVTEEYTDLEAQLVNARAQEKQYLAILDKAKNVEEILKVQDYLGRVRQQIEQLQGRLKYLENMTSYSTIACYLEEEPVVQMPTKEFRPLSSLKEAVQTLVEAAQGLAVAVIWIVIVGGGALLPFAFLALVIWLVVRAIRRRKKQ